MSSLKMYIILNIFILIEFAKIFQNRACFYKKIKTSLFTTILGISKGILYFIVLITITISSITIF